jgi:hypothetical protein
MFRSKTSILALCAAAGFGLASGVALAADVDDPRLPAVSAFNGKLEGYGGWSDIDLAGIEDDVLLKGAASISFPLGDMFGAQFDFSAVHQFDDTMIGGNVHLFTRDPSSYLFGVVAGAATMDDADLLFGGPELEFYLDSVSIELWGGYVNVGWDGLPDEDKFFAFADLAWYANDDLRLTLGASSVADFESAHASVEWMFGKSLPMSLKADVRYGEDDYIAATAGLSIYFGGTTDTLISRHREDDPRNRQLDLFSAAGTAFIKPVVKPTKPPPEPPPPPPPPPECDDIPENDIPDCPIPQ